MSDAAVHLPLAGELREQEHQLEGGGVEGKILNRCFVHFFLSDVLLAEGATKEKCCLLSKVNGRDLFFCFVKNPLLGFLLL